MVKDRPPLVLDAVLGVLAAAAHPSPSEKVRAALLAYVTICIAFPKPAVRFVLIPVATGGLKAISALGFATSYLSETDFALFLLASVLWAVLPSGFSGKRRGAVYVVGMGTLGFAALPLGFLFLWLLDRIVPPLGPLFIIELGNAYRRIHLAAVAIGAIAFFLLLWGVAWAWRRRGSAKVLAYADGYLACRRELTALSRRWKC